MKRENDGIKDRCHMEKPPQTSTDNHIVQDHSCEDSDMCVCMREFVCMFPCVHVHACCMYRVHAMICHKSLTIEISSNLTSHNSNLPVILQNAVGLFRLSSRSLELQNNPRSAKAKSSKTAVQKTRSPIYLAYTYPSSYL